MGGVKNKTMSQINITKKHSKPTRINNVYEGGKKPRKRKTKQLEDNIIKNVRNSSYIKLN